MRKALLIFWWKYHFALWKMAAEIRWQVCSTKCYIIVRTCYHPYIHTYIYTSIPYAYMYIVYVCAFMNLNPSISISVFRYEYIWGWIHRSIRALALLLMLPNAIPLYACRAHIYQIYQLDGSVAAQDLKQCNCVCECVCLYVRETPPFLGIGWLYLYTFLCTTDGYTIAISTQNIMLVRKYVYGKTAFAQDTF